MSEFTTACPDAAALDPLKRVCYSTGLVLGVDEFRQEQEYFLAKDRLHQRALHGYGTVCGLKVSIEDAGAGLGLALYGARALMSLRLEKSWGVWTLEYRPDFTPVESGLDAFVAFDKPADFIGKTAATAQRDAGGGKTLVTLVVDADDVD